MNNNKLQHTPCGQNCQKCHFFRENCEGCMQKEGVPFWAKSAGMKICPIYNCSANIKKLEHCGLCKLYPCHTYLDLRDPSMTEEEWQNSLKERKLNLIRRRKEHCNK